MDAEQIVPPTWPEDLPIPAAARPGDLLVAKVGNRVWTAELGEDGNHTPWEEELPGD